MTITKVQYGMTFNLGNYQSERIDAEVQPEPGETPEQAIARARAFVLGQHEAAEIERERGEEMARLRSQIKNITYYIDGYRESLAAAGQEDTYSAVQPEGLSDLALLQWQEADAKAHKKALQDQLEARRKAQNTEDPPF